MSHVKGHMPLESGLTLIEILISVGIMAGVMAAAFFLSVKYYYSYAATNERSALVSVLLKARSEAINNVCFGDDCTGGRPHGVKIVYDAGTREIEKYVIFQGESYDEEDPLNEEISPGYHLFFSDEEPDIISEISFEQLSGRVDTNGGGEDMITLTDNNDHSFSIAINTEGRINW